MRSVEQPQTVHTGQTHSESVTTHPAFGQIGASRVSGGAYLYGSDFSHQHYMTIRIRASELHRNLSRDWHFAKDELIEVALSEAQWATFVSSMNTGSGVPCTLQQVAYKSVPGLPKPPKIADQFKAEMVKTVADIQADLKALRGEVGGLGIGKKKAEDLQQRLARIHDRLIGSTSFVADQFEEHIEGVIESAKVEVNAYVVNQVMRAGLDSLGAKPVLQLAGD
jgi:hypothetical protein